MDVFVAGRREHAVANMALPAWKCAQSRSFLTKKVWMIRAWGPPARFRGGPGSSTIFSGERRLSLGRGTCWLWPKVS